MAHTVQSHTRQAGGSRLESFRLAGSALTVSADTTMGSLYALHELDCMATQRLRKAVSKVAQTTGQSSLREPCITKKLEVLVSGGGTDVEVV